MKSWIFYSAFLLTEEVTIFRTVITLLSSSLLPLLPLLSLTVALFSDLTTAADHPRGR